MSYFQEIGALDRPFVPVTISFGLKKVEFQVRSLSAKDADAIDALQMDEYGRLLQKFTERVDGSVNEVERVERVYAAQSHRRLVDQLMPTREAEIDSRAFEESGIDFRAALETLQAFETDEEREAYSAEQNERLEAVKVEVRAAVRAELDAQPVEELARLLAQVNTNVRAQMMAAQASNVAYLYYTLYSPSGERAFGSIEEVEENLTPVKIGEIVKQVKEALTTGLPFESPADEEPSTPPSSPSTSAEATKAGGKRTKTTKGASKPSTTPA